MVTKKQNDDIGYTVAVAGRVLNDANVEYLVVGIDGEGKLEATMSPSFGAAVDGAKFVGESEDGLFRFSRMTETLKMVADVVTGAEMEHRRRHGIPLIDTFDIEEIKKAGRGIEVNNKKEGK